MDFAAGLCFVYDISKRWERMLQKLLYPTSAESSCQNGLLTFVCFGSGDVRNFYGIKFSAYRQNMKVFHFD